MVKNKFKTKKPVQPFRIKIETLNEDGQGVGFYQKRVIKVPKTLPGEEVEVVYRPDNPRRARIELRRIHTPSRYRVSPPCVYFQECGGCHLQHLAYPEQLRFKRQVIQRSLLPYPDLKSIEIHPVVGMPNPLYYRNKCQMPFRFQDGEPVFGLYRAGTHELIPIDQCVVESRDANVALRIVRDWLRRHRVPVYDERSGEGLVRHLLVRKGFFTNQVMVVLVSTSEQLPHWQDLLKALKEGLPSLHSFQINVNAEQSNRILGSRTVPVFGKPYILEQIGHLKFRIYPETFFQINSLQTVKILETMQRELQLEPQHHLLDLFSGVGVFSLSLARSVKAVTGIEIVAGAVKAARENALDNGIQNARFLAEDATRWCIQQIEAARQFDVVLLNPPRKGLTPELIESVVKMKPRQVAYLSCHPRSLARDLAHFHGLGYRCSAIFPFDMFPQTYHVEALAFLRRAD